LHDVTLSCHQLNTCASQRKLRQVTLESKLNQMQNMHQVTLLNGTFRSPISVPFYLA